MKKLLAVTIMLGAVASIAGGSELPRKITDETPAQKAERMAWWQNDRFGMFIHFGLYSVPGRHEWIRTREAIDDETYDKKYLPRFDPDLFDAKEWARQAKAAGMKYVVLTTKHHEGFCMWDTKTTDYKITKTAFGRDLVKEYVEAMREAGLKVGFYFSIMDWHHPDYTVDCCHPLMARLWKEGKKGKELEDAVNALNKGRDMNRYREYMYAQVRELLTNYGKIDIIWFDYTPVAEEFGKTYRDWNAVELVKLTRKLQPGIIMDNRLDLMDTDDGWDFVTPEQFKASAWPTVRGEKVPWETCQTFSGSWGYFRDEETWKSMPQLIELLSETVSKGGNLIMNVGPTARGEFDWRAKERLEGFAKWMHANSRSIYGCTVAPEGLVAPNGTAITYNPKTNRAYIHLYDYPMGYLPVEWLDRIEYAQFLHDGSEISLRQPPKAHSQTGDTHQIGGLVLPMKKPAVEIPVVELWLKRDSSASAAGCLHLNERSLEDRIAAAHKVLVSDDWGGGHRMIFDFGGRKAWIVEPKSGAAVDGNRRWVWTMQWMGAYLNRTGAPDLVERGWRHVHLEAFDTRANDDGLKALSDFQDYLVRELGFAPKANLIGMSWGGFYSIRYANAFPEKVSRIYLDAPLLNFDGFGGDATKTPTAAAALIGPWAKFAPAGGNWSADVRMPVNMAASIAAAKIPVYLLYGGKDQTVNPALNCERFVSAFKDAGGDIRVEKRGLYGHHPHGFEHEDIFKIVNFFEGTEK